MDIITDKLTLAYLAGAMDSDGYIEANPEYIKMAEKRIAEIQPMLL